jgi:integral membrane protein (TIGR01906 family)
MNKKRLALIISILLIIDIPFILYLSNSNNLAFDENFYKKEFEKYNVYDSLEDYDIEEINSELLNYLKYEKNDVLIDNDFFNEREKTHLLDVKNLIQKTILLYYFTIILFFILLISLIFLLKRNITIIKYLGIIFLISGLLTFLDAFAFFAIINSDFASSFDVFHSIFFEQGSFLFDPSSENIVVLYPESLFFDITYSIAISTLIFSFLMFLVGILFLVIIKYKTGKFNKKIFKQSKKKNI